MSKALLGIHVFSLFSLLTLLPLVSAKEPSSFEKIYIAPSTSPYKRLVIYRFEALEDFPPASLFTPVYAIPPSLIREIMVNSGADKSLDVSLSNGRLSPLEKRTVFEDWTLPFEGLSVKAQTSGVLDWQGVLLQVSELLGVSVSPLFNSNSFGNSTVFGNLRYEFFSPENLIKIVHLLPCSGEKGAFFLFDKYQIFAADYAGLHFSLKRTETGRVKMQVDMAFEIDRQRRFFSYYFNHGAFSQCPAANSSQIHIEGKLERTIEPYGLLLVSDLLDDLSLEKYSEETAVKPKISTQLQKTKLRQARWVSSSSVDWQGVLVHDILNQTPDDLLCSVYTYLPYEAYPQLSGVQIQPKGVFKMGSTHKRAGKDNDHLIRTTVVIKSGQEIKLRIPFKKLLRQFETFSHDPQRGKDLPAMPVQCQKAKGKLGNGELIVDELSPSVLVYFPEPDYSMPFNVLTIGMGVIGYLTITMFRFSF